MSSKVTAIAKYQKPLSPKELQFVQNVAIYGMSEAQAGRQAGFGSSGNSVAARPHVAAAIREQHTINAQKIGLTRDDVIKEIQKDIADARLITEPMTAIAGWREIAKISGFYDTEAAKKDLTDKQRRFLQMIQELPEEQLLAMAAKDVNIIDAETGEATKS